MSNAPRNAADGTKHPAPDEQRTAAVRLHPLPCSRFVAKYVDGPFATFTRPDAIAHIKRAASRAKSPIARARLELLARGVAVSHAADNCRFCGCKLLNDTERAARECGGDWCVS